MEAIHNNPVFFELVADRAWSADAGSTAGFAGSPASATASSRHALEAAWVELAATVFNGSSAQIFPEFFISATVTKPGFGSLLGADATIHDDIRSALYFDPQILRRAWRTLTDVARERPDLVDGPLGADLVQVGAAALVRIIDFRLSGLLREAVESGRTATETVAVLPVGLRRPGAARGDAA